MRTQPQSSQSRIPRTRSLVTLALVILFGCLSQVVAQQQKDVDTTNADSNNSAPSGRVNLSTFQMFNGEYLEMFGAGTSRGILRGHPTIPAIELGSHSADPLIFSTNSIERMRILANGFVGIGTTNPINPFEVYFADGNVYSPATTSPARVRFMNTNSTLNNVFEIDLGAQDSAGNIQTGVRLAAIFTNKTPGQMSGDFAIGARNLGAFTELARFTSGGNVGIGTPSPSSRLHVNGGTIRLASVAGETPFQIYSYANSHSLWLTSGNPTTSEIYLSPGYAVDFDRSLGFQYTPGTTGTAGGILRIGQINKNAATFTHGATALHTNGVERLRINSAGNVGIGTANPGYRLDVQGGQVNASLGLCMNGDCRNTWPSGGNSQWTTIGANIFYSDGSVGINSTNLSAKLQVAGVGVGGTAIFLGSTFASHFNYNGDNSEDTYIRGGKNTSRVIINDQSAATVAISPGGGNVGVGTFSPTSKLHVAGDGRFTGSLTVDGNIAAKYQDVAEWVPASTQLAPGPVVVLDSTKSNHVVSSSKSYDTRVAGVVSAQPGITLGEQSEDKVLVATTGRVRVKVDATDGPIEIGDLLVTSTREGFAMKSRPVEIAGSQMHRPGTLIGKALESLPRGTGEILVLLSMQ